MQKSAHSYQERAAKDFARIMHKEQKDDDGKDYFESHLVQVNEILSKVTDDPDILAAGWLHDILEDTKVSFEDLVNMFGKKIADLVLEMTHSGKKDNIGFYFPRLQSRDAILIKYADRLSNLVRMDSWSKDRQQHYLKKSKFWKSSPSLQESASEIDISRRYASIQRIEKTLSDREAVLKSKEAQFDQDYLRLREREARLEKTREPEDYSPIKPINILDRVKNAKFISVKTILPTKEFKHVVAIIEGHAVLCPVTDANFILRKGVCVFYWPNAEWIKDECFGAVTHWFPVPNNYAS